MNREKNISIFKDNLKIDYNFQSKVYKEKDFLSIKNDYIKIIWSNNTVETIFEISKSFNRIGALNFADPFLIGGLVLYGEITQEECLCRSSNLYKALSQCEKDFYEYNKEKNKTTDRIIYSPNVLFFREDDLKITKTPCFCDIISCAAPPIKENCSDEEIKKRMKNIILCAIDNNIDCLILGKWGCGAFGNDWDRFLNLWQLVIKENDFDKK